jgi:hypothetical protein
MAIYYFRNVGTDWNTASNWSATDGGGATGVVPLATDDAYFTSNSGSCTVSTATRVCKTLIFSGVGAGNYANTFTLNNTLTVSGSITLSSTMTFAGTSTITINATSTITTNTKIFTCNIIASGTITLTLGDDVYIGGNLSFGTVVGTTVTINGNTLYCGGSLTGSGNIVLGTSNITMNGSGTLSLSGFSSYLGGSGTFTFNTTGTININNHVFLSAGKTIQYIAGNVFLPRGQSLTIINSGGITSLDLKGVKFYGSVNMTTRGSISLISDFIIDGGVFSSGSTLIGSPQPLVLNSSGGNLYLGDQSIPSSISSSSGGVASITGTATIYIKGNGICVFAVSSPVSNNIVFDFTGILRITNTNFFGGELVGLALNNGTYTFINGRVNSISFNVTNLKNQGTISIAGNATLIGFDKFSGVGNIRITNAVTLTMDKFFSGRPDCISKVFCATTTGAYTITFQDTFEKFANWVKVSNCTLTRRGQLLILNQKATTNIGRNTGVRYNNVWPNGIAKDSPIIPNPPMAFGAVGLLSDPAFS